MDNLYINQLGQYQDLFIQYYKKLNSKEKFSEEFENILNIYLNFHKSFEIPELFNKFSKSEFQNLIEYILDVLFEKIKNGEENIEFEKITMNIKKDFELDKEIREIEQAINILETLKKSKLNGKSNNNIIENFIPIKSMKDKDKDKNNIKLKNKKKETKMVINANANANNNTKNAKNSESIINYTNKGLERVEKSWNNKKKKDTIDNKIINYFIKNGFENKYTLEELQNDTNLKKVQNYLYWRKNQNKILIKTEDNKYMLNEEIILKLSLK